MQVRGGAVGRCVDDIQYREVEQIQHDLEVKGVVTGCVSIRPRCAEVNK